MKNRIKFIIIFITMFSVLSVYSQQIPQTFNYQGIAHQKDGKPLVNKEIIIEFSILKGIANGEIEYQEVHHITTNGFGLFNTEVGNGTSTFTGNTFDFSEIEWNSDIFFLKTRIDFGDENFINGMIDIGFSKFQSVPYSFSCQRAIIADSLSLPISINLIDLADINIDVPLDNQVIAWDADNLKWIATDPTGDTGVFLRTDGTADLTEDWTISSDNIILTNGNIFINSGKLQTNELQLNTGTSISEISTDETFSGNSDNIIVTERAIKTYINSELAFIPWIVTDLYIYNDDTKNIGIGTETPEHKFHVELNMAEGVLFSGDFGGSIPSLNVGTHMTFYPSKAAFRAGRIQNQNDFWNNENVGDYSAGFGYDTKADGDYTFVCGKDNQANGNYSFAGGRENIAANAYSCSFGQNNNSLALYSFTCGTNNSAYGIAASVFGSNNIAYGDNSFVFGSQCITGSGPESGGDNSLAFGESAIATGNSSLSFGYQTETKGLYSLATGENTETRSSARSAAVFGNSTTAYGNFSLAGGFNTKARSYAETVFGKYNHSIGNNSGTWIETDVLFAIGNGTSTDESNALVILKNGNTGIGLGQSTPTYLLEVGNNGDGTEAIANAWQTFSDIRLKKDFKIIESPIEKLKMLNGYYYFWKNGEDKSKQIGVIAQEVEKVLPEIVTENKTGYKSVDYSKLTPLLIEAVKEQETEIEKLRKKNNNLNNKIEIIEKKIENLEKYVKAAANIKIIDK